MVQLAAAAVRGLALTVFGLAESLWFALVCLAVAGVADTVSVATRGTLVQLAIPDSHRGRVSSVEYVLGVSGPDIGNFRAGAVAGLTSPAFAAVSGGVLCLLGLAGLAMGNASLRRFGTQAADTTTQAADTTTQAADTTTQAADTVSDG